MAAEHLTDTRTGKNIGHHLVPFFRQSIYSRLAGYPDIIDADQLARDPAMRTVVSRKAVSKRAAPKSSVNGGVKMYQLRRSENVPPAAAIFPYHLHSRIASEGLKRNALRFRAV